MSQLKSKQINEQNGEESCRIRHRAAPGMRGGIAGAAEERDAPESLPTAAPRSWAGGRAARAHPRVQRRLLHSELGDASPDTLKVWGGSGLRGAGARPVAAGARRARSPRPAGTAPRRRRGKMASGTLRLLLLLCLGVLSCKCPLPALRGHRDPGGHADPEISLSVLRGWLLEAPLSPPSSRSERSQVESPGAKRQGAHPPPQPGGCALDLSILIPCRCNLFRARLAGCESAVLCRRANFRMRAAHFVFLFRMRTAHFVFLFRLHNLFS